MRVGGFAVGYLEVWKGKGIAGLKLRVDVHADEKASRGRGVRLGAMLDDAHDGLPTC